MWRSHRVASTPCCSRKSSCSSRFHLRSQSERSVAMANGKDQVDQNALAAEWGLSLDPEGGAEGGAKTDAAGASDAAGEWQEAAAQQWAAAVDEGPSFGSGSKSGAERVLTQEEIDGLLGFSVADVSLNDHSGIRAIIDSAMVSYERLPMLEIVFDRLVRL